MQPKTRKKAKTPRSKLRMILIALLVAIGYVFLGNLVFGSMPHGVLLRFVQMNRRLAALESARSQWDSKNIVHYQMTVNDDGYFDPIFIRSCGAAILQIRDGDVVQIDVPQAPSSSSEFCQSYYSTPDYSVDGLFEIAGDYLSESPLLVQKIDIQYESDLGYITHLSVEAFVGGIWPLSIYDPSESPIPAFFEIQVSDFEILEQ